MRNAVLLGEWCNCARAKPAIGSDGLSILCFSGQQYDALFTQAVQLHEVIVAFSAHPMAGDLGTSDRRLVEL
jgi:hypothetical protein